MHRDLDQITRPNSSGIRKFEPQFTQKPADHRHPLRLIRVWMWKLRLNDQIRNN
jgi:hypothetical protein